MLSFTQEIRRKMSHRGINTLNEVNSVHHCVYFTGKIKIYFQEILKALALH